jgi:DNA-binding transcriptional ArsR family regulator
LGISGLSDSELRRRLDVDHKTVMAAAADGLTDVQADHWAVALGWHPLSVWGWEWVDLADQAGPIHVRLAAALRERIESGDLAPGDRLPTGRALAERYDVSRRSVSRALAELRDEGLVVMGPGSYWFVVVDAGREVLAS